MIANHVAQLRHAYREGARSVIDLCANPEKKAADLQAAIIGYTDAKLDAKWFGQKLATDVGKITDSLRLCYDKDTHTKINIWWVERLE